MRTTTNTGRARRLAILLLVLPVSLAVTALAVGLVAVALAGDKNAPWILGRSAGISSFALLTLLVISGMVLSHPGRSRMRWPNQAVRIKFHICLAVFTTVFVAVHIVVLATDSYAGVGWQGALVPMGATYRPVPVTLGVIGLYAGMAAGITAALSSRISPRVWIPIHRVAVLAFAAIWAHSVLAGTDTPALLVLYLASGIIVLVLGAWRYTARTRADEVAAQAAATDALLPAPVRSAVFTGAETTSQHDVADGVGGRPL